jgi:hypothetical protein
LFSSCLNVCVLTHAELHYMNNICNWAFNTSNSCKQKISIKILLRMNFVVQKYEKLIKRYLLEQDIGPKSRNNTITASIVLPETRHVSESGRTGMC